MIREEGTVLDSGGWSVVHAPDLVSDACERKGNLSSVHLATFQARDRVSLPALPRSR